MTLIIYVLLKKERSNDVVVESRDDIMHPPHSCDTLHDHQGESLRTICYNAFSDGIIQTYISLISPYPLIL